MSPKCNWRIYGNKDLLGSDTIAIHLTGAFFKVDNNHQHVDLSPN
jgi:hypothetical protein